MSRIDKVALLIEVEQQEKEITRLHQRVKELEAERIYAITQGVEDEQRIEELEAEKNRFRQLCFQGAAYLAMMSHDYEADISDMCERLRIEAISFRKKIDKAMEGEG